MSEIALTKRPKRNPNRSPTASTSSENSCNRQQSKLEEPPKSKSCPKKAAPNKRSSTKEPCQTSILNHLIEAQGNPIQFLVSDCTNKNKKTLKIAKSAAKAQESEKQSNSSEFFKEACGLVETLEQMGHDKESCEFDVSLVLKTIAYAEEHPDPEELGGIDLKNLYTTLSLMSMGYPTPELDGETLLFLTECVDNLRQDLSNPVQQEQIADMQSQFDSKCPNPASISHLSATLTDSLTSKVLNPLGLSLPPIVTRNSVPSKDE